MVLAVGGKPAEKSEDSPETETKSENGELVTSVKELITELKSLHSIENKSIKEVVPEEIQEKVADSQTDIDVTEKMVTEMLPQVLPEIIKDVLSAELKKIKGQVD